MLLMLGSVLFFGFRTTILHAQGTIPAAGGIAFQSGQGSVAYSVGQVIYTTNTGIPGSVTQGIQQPYEISVISGINEAQDINLLISAYPNPATEYLILRTDNSEVMNLSYRLFDNNGKLLESETVSGYETSIETDNFASGIYFLKVFGNSKELKTFKIIKN
jgi:hypothetical protein